MKTTYIFLCAFRWLSNLVGLADAAPSRRAEWKLGLAEVKNHSGASLALRATPAQSSIRKGDHGPLCQGPCP